MAKQIKLPVDKTVNNKTVNGKIINEKIINEKKFIFIGLTILNLIIYYRVIFFNFVSFDDKNYVYDNYAVRDGVTFDSIKWAFTTFTMGHWHPITWLSYIFNYQFFGLNPHAFHTINLVLHLINTILIFYILDKFTKQHWPAAFVAALFAIHPLHVEPVAWVAARKDLLATMFGLITILAYYWYAKKSASKARYLTMLSMYALALMSKSSLLPLPFLLILLDYWPLQRLSLPVAGESFSEWWKKLSPFVLDKIPMFVMMIIVIVVEFVAMSPGTVILPEYYDKINREFSAPGAIKNGIRAFENYWFYIIKMLWPIKLAAYYPYLPPRVYTAIFGAGLLLLSACLFAFTQIQRFPYLFVGWFWYVGMMVPSSWILQADRYTYLPLVGLFIIIAWGADEFIKKHQINKKIVIGAALLILAPLSILSWRQVGYWRDNLTLYTYVLSVTDENLLMHYNLALELTDQNRLEEAAQHFAETVALQPKYAEGYCGLGNIAMRYNNIDQAADFYGKAVAANKELPEGHYGLGRALYLQGNLNEAIKEYQAAIKLRPDYAEVYSYMGLALMAQGKNDAAITNFQKAIALSPVSPEAHFNYGNALVSMKRYDEAIFHLNIVKKIRPDIADTYNNLGISQTEKLQYDQAILNYQEAIKLRPESAEFHYNYGNLLIKLGKKDEAAKQFQDALHYNPNFDDAIKALQSLDNDNSNSKK